MKDQVTTIEQSKRLIEMGVPTEKASMFIVGDVGVYPRFYVEAYPNLRRFPAFTVADLLGLIKPTPFTTNVLNPTLEKIGENEWAFELGQISENEDFGYAHNKSLVDLLVDRIEWLLSNGYKLEV